MRDPSATPDWGPSCHKGRQGTYGAPSGPGRADEPREWSTLPASIKHLQKHISRDLKALQSNLWLEACLGFLDSKPQIQTTAFEVLHPNLEVQTTNLWASDWNLHPYSWRFHSNLFVSSHLIWTFELELKVQQSKENPVIRSFTLWWPAVTYWWESVWSGSGTLDPLVVQSRDMDNSYENQNIER